MEYIHRLRSDLSAGASELLSSLPADHADRGYLGDVLSAVLVAGLYPRLAWLKRWGKGETIRGLKVTAHPGSVSKSASNTLVVFYEVQETTDRYLYDTSAVQMAVCLLFAPKVEMTRRTPTRARLELGAWTVSVDAAVADELLALRRCLAEFVQRSVGEAPTAVHLAATDALGALFSERAPLVEANDDDDDDDGPAGAAGGGGGGGGSGGWRAVLEPLASQSAMGSHALRPPEAYQRQSAGRQRPQAQRQRW